MHSNFKSSTFKETNESTNLESNLAAEVLAAMNSNQCNRFSSDNDSDLVSSKKCTSQVAISDVKENGIRNSEELPNDSSVDVAHHECFYRKEHARSVVCIQCIRCME